MHRSRGVARLAGIEAGPGLAAALSSVDRSGLTAGQLPLLVAARQRQSCHEQAQLLVDLVAMARKAVAPFGGQVRYSDAELERVAVAEIGLTLHCGEAHARDLLDLGRELVTRLPDVLAVFLAGRIDQAKAAAFVQLLAGVPIGVAQRIAARLLPHAELQTLVLLRTALRRAVDRVDPGAARRRHQRRVTERRFWLCAGPDGTASMGGSDLPAHRAAAGFDRVDRLARTARAAGDVRNLNQLRADVFLDLLQGLPFTVRPSADATTRQADTHYRQPSDAGDLTPPDPARRREPGDEPRLDVEPSESPDAIDLYDYDRACVTDADRWWADQLCAQQPGPSDAVTTIGEDDQRHATAQGTVSVQDKATADWDPVVGQDGMSAGQGNAVAAFVGGPVLPADRCGDCGGLLPAQRSGVVDVQVLLTTLAGLDDHPGVIAGLGSCLADVARQIALDHIGRPTWRYSVFNADGVLRHHGITTRRPHTPASNPSTIDSHTTGPGDQECRSEDDTHTHEPDVKCRSENDTPCTCPRLQTGERRGTVELQLDEATLAALIANPPPGFEALITDIAAQVANDSRDNPATKWSEVDSDGRPAPLGHTGRHPNAVEAAFIRARDRTCRFPTCTRMAAHCDLDHAVEHARGGPSHRSNCRCLCKVHHILRHLPGVTVTTEGDTTIWTLPNGHRYYTHHGKDVILPWEARSPH